MTSTAGEPSLLQFLRDRLSQDIDLILADTPIFGVEVDDSEFERRFLDRAGLLQRVRTELAMVARTVDSMQTEQGAPPVTGSFFEGGPVTDLGSKLLKLLAARYADHPDYRTEWMSKVDLPKP